MLTGENGILTQAQNASIKTGRANVIEQARTDIMGKQTEEGSANLIKSDVKVVLEKYFESVPDDFTLDTELQTKDEYGDYQILVSEIYTGEIKNVILGKDVLIPNKDGTTPEEKSPYVMYNNLLCRVLYNDDTHGLQIVTDDNITEVTLGYGDSTVTADDFAYDGEATVDDNFKKAAASYNAAVDTLTNKSKEYIGTKAIDARSLGSIATLGEDGNFQVDTNTQMWSSTKEYLSKYNLNGKLKKSVYNYTEDYNKIVELKIYSTDSNINTWLPGRAIGGISTSDYSYTEFNIYYLTNTGGVQAQRLFMIDDNSIERSYNYSYGLRPIFLLPFDIIISGGDGTKDNPYVIE